MSGISLSNHSIKNHLIPSYREKVLTILVKPCHKTRKQNPCRNYQTSNAFSEFVSDLNHMEFMFKLKGIEWGIQYFKNNSIPSYTERDTNQKAETAPATISWNSTMIPQFKICIFSTKITQAEASHSFFITEPNIQAIAHTFPLCSNSISCQAPSFCLKTTHTQ